MSCGFDIKRPTTLKNIRIFFNSKDNKNKLLENIVLDRLDEDLGITYRQYCEDHWLWGRRYGSYGINYEDKVKSFLDRCGTFLLLGQFEKGEVLTDYMYKLARYKEVSYSGDWKDEENEVILEEEVVKLKNKNTLNEKIIQNNIKQKYKKYYKKRKKRKKKISKSQKIMQIFSSPKVIRNTLYNPTNKEIYDKNNIKYPKFKNDKDLKKWLNKSYKNIYGEKIWDYKMVEYGGHKGIINPNRPYISKWCVVDTRNIFEFQNKKYMISKNIKQYQVGKDNKCEMDMILVFEQDGNMYFFDQDINEINEKYIYKIG